MRSHVEREAKLTVPEDFSLPELHPFTVDEPTAKTFRPGSMNAVALWGVAFPSGSVTAKLSRTLMLSPGVTNPPTEWFWSRLRVIACEMLSGDLPFSHGSLTDVSSRRREARSR